MGIPVPVPWQGSDTTGLEKRVERARGVMQQHYNSRTGDFENWQGYAAQLDTHEQGERAVSGPGVSAGFPVVHYKLMERYLVDKWGFSGVPTTSYSWTHAVSTLAHKMEYGLIDQFRDSDLSASKAAAIAAPFFDLFDESSASFYGSWIRLSETVAGDNGIRLPKEREHLCSFVLCGVEPGFIAVVAFYEDD